MQLLNIENCQKRYGEKLLFENLNFSISKGQKIALVAKNGSGKTTLLRLIAGEEGPEGENAKIELNQDTHRYYLRQEPKFLAGSTVMETVYDSENPVIRLIHEHEMALLSNDAEKIQELALKMDDQKAWKTEVRIKETLSRFNILDLDQSIDELSGGQIKRLALAKMIIDEPAFIILDEPTNHLDLDMIEWLEQYLQNPNLTIFMVTHDRYFLERICSEIFEIDQAALHIYRGNYSQYLEKKENRVQNELVNQEKAQKLYKKELEWIRRMPKARGTKAKSRVEKFSEIKAQAFNKRDDTSLKINLKSSRMGSKILEAHAISKSYGDLSIVESFSYKFKKRERLGLVGKNGVGKSTFLDLLTQKIRPDGGKIVVGDTIKFGYYTQDGITLNQDKRVIEVIRDIAEYIPLEKGLKLTAESLLETFLFPRSQQQVYVSQLSGGERRRLYLLTILMENPNFLILDEPTNDLDILTLNVLEDYLMQFPGCLLVVSHDRYFLDKMVDHLFIMEGKGVIKDYNFTYTEYRNEVKSKRYDVATKGDIGPSKTERQEKQEKVVDREKQKKIKNRINKIERELEQLETRKSSLTEKFMEELSMEDITKYSKELEEVKSAIDAFEEEWMVLSEENQT